jgi:hypothetical protein
VELILNFVKSGTVRRWVIGLIASVILAVNGKFALGLSTETLGMITAIAIALILGSNYKEAQGIIAAGNAKSAESAASSISTALAEAMANAPTVITSPPPTDTEAASRLGKL